MNGNDNKIRMQHWKPIPTRRCSEGNVRSNVRIFKTLKYFKNRHAGTDFKDNLLLAQIFCGKLLRNEVESVFDLLKTAYN